MAVKYVKDFAFDSGFGFSGSSGKTPVKSHMRSPMKKADGGAVKSKGFDNSTRNPISKFPDIAPAMVGKPTKGMGGKTPETKKLAAYDKPHGAGKKGAKVAQYAKGGKVKKAHAKKEMPSFLKGKTMRKAEGGPVDEILPSDGMSPLQRMSGDDYSTRMTEMNRQLAQLLAGGDAPAGPPGMMAPIDGPAPRMDPGVIDRLTPKKEYGINPPRLPAEPPMLVDAGPGGGGSGGRGDVNLDSHHRLNRRPSDSDDMVYAGGGGHDRLNPPEMDPGLIPEDPGYEERMERMRSIGSGPPPIPPEMPISALSSLARAAQSPARMNARRAAMGERGNMRNEKMAQARDIMDRYIAGPRRAMPSRRAMPVAPRAPMIQPPRDPRGGIATFAKGGAVKGNAVKTAVHKHEKAKHPGKPLTKLRKGGMPCG
jgi:hypothetical protein